MNVTVPLWSMPLAATVFFILMATLVYQTGKGRGDYSSFGNAVLLLFYGGLSIILSLIVWLIYFIIV